jgi:predicted Rossmann-fold nucleotide-binding protein
MAAVSESFYRTPNRRGLVIGILPLDESLEVPRDGYPNPWVEIPILTHLPLGGDRGAEPLSRNHINILTSDVIVALPGDAGTGSEVGLAVGYGRPLIAFVESDQEIPELPYDVSTSSSLEGVQTFVVAQLGLVV